MNLSGHYLIEASPEEIRQYFQKPDFLQRVLPYCVSVEELESDKYLGTIQRTGVQNEFVKYRIWFTAGENDRQFHLSIKAADANALILNIRHVITLIPQSSSTVLRFNSTAKIRKTSVQSNVEPSKIHSIIVGIFENVSALLNEEENKMTDKKQELESALHKAEDAVIELEHEAEQAAATGVWGGAQMWGWIALAVLVLVLMMFFR